LCHSLHGLIRQIKEVLIFLPTEIDVMMYSKNRGTGLLQKSLGNRGKFLNFLSKIIAGEKYD
jgi:hypothetical protein